MFFYSQHRGMTFIDVIVAVGIIVTVFLALFGAFRLSIDLVYNTKAKAGGVALMTEQVEYIRTLPYSMIGTVGGIPSGTIPQVQQKTLNNISYSVRTLVQYIDAPEDGTGNSDTNAVTADYKSVKVEVTWTIRSQPRAVFIVTRVSPHGVESLTSGGTLRVNVFDAIAVPIQDATVRIQNSTTNPAIDVYVDSDSGGSVSFPGAPTAASYRVTVTKSGYSSGQTYDAVAPNTNPNPGHVAVVNQKTTTISFAIDKLGSLQTKTWNPKGSATFDDTFSNASKLLATSSTVVSGGSLMLEGVAGSYAPVGSAQSISINPSYLSSWTSATWVASTTGSTPLTIQIYYWDGSTWVLVPNTDLPGNSVGFSNSPVSLATLSVSQYSRLALGATLASPDPAWTPELLDWHVNYVAGPTPLPSIPFDIHGTKTIGSTALGVPIYKVTESHTTDANGQYLMTPLEWDSYAVTIPGTTYDVMERCPYAVSVTPAQNQVVSLTLAPHASNTLLTYVVGNNVAIANASVRVTQGSVNDVSTTSACGQTFLSGIPAATYSVTVTAPGFQNHVESIPVLGQTVYPVTLVPN